MNPGSPHNPSDPTLLRNRHIASWDDDGRTASQGTCAWCRHECWTRTVMPQNGLSVPMHLLCTSDMRDAYRLHEAGQPLGELEPGMRSLAEYLGMRLQATGGHPSFAESQRRMEAALDTPQLALDEMADDLRRLAQ